MVDDDDDNDDNDDSGGFGNDEEDFVKLGANPPFLDKQWIVMDYGPIRTMLAVLKDVELLMRVNAPIIDGSPAHKSVKVAIANAEAANISDFDP